MPKIGARDLNRTHADYVADPVTHKERFWTSVRNYVERACYIVPARFKEDLVHDIILEVMTDLGRYKPGTNFQKWLSAVIRNLRADSFKANIYECPEKPVSQLGTWDEDGSYAEFEPSALESADSAEDRELLQSESERIACASAKLDAVRANLTKHADLQLFDLLRSGLSLAQAAMRMGASYSAVQRRFARWKIKLAGKCLTAPELEIETVESRKMAA
ncbi:MAG: sigma-70 family RNA polymerase sigma factor [Acidobacteriota bacterium]|nr:sigma-70 family RNA polymerase sigma factor [Acidobacteriota bacterium]